MLDTTWFLSEPIDLEHKQYLLLDFLQKADTDFKRERIDPYLFDVKYHLSNIECFLTTKCLVPKKKKELSAEDRDRLKWFDSLADGSAEKQEINAIVKWSFKKLQEKYKDGAKAWKKIESELKMFYIGDIPEKIYEGYVIIKYGAAEVAEVYRFKFNSSRSKLDVKLHGYEEVGNDPGYGTLRFKLVIDTDLEDPVFIGIETPKTFDTKASLLPIIKTIISGYVITDKAWSVK